MKLGVNCKPLWTLCLWTRSCIQQGACLLMDRLDWLPVLQSTRSDSIFFGGNDCCSVNFFLLASVQSENPVNLSISLSGGKEIKQDSLSSGEWTGRSSSWSAWQHACCGVLWSRCDLLCVVGTLCWKHTFVFDKPQWVIVSYRLCTAGLNFASEYDCLGVQSEYGR